jgi:hypothetical protein
LCTALLIGWNPATLPPPAFGLIYEVAILVSQDGRDIFVIFTGTTNVQCCGSGMFIPDPDFYPSRIPYPKTATKERGEKKIFHTFFCSHKFHKIENYRYLIFEMLKKKLWASFQKIIELFTQKVITKLSKIWVWDPEKNLSRIRIYNTVNVISDR